MKQEDQNLNSPKIFTNGIETRISDVTRKIGGKKSTCEITGLSESQLNRILAGKNQCKVEPLTVMAKAANVSIEWLITGKGNKTSGIHGKNEIKQEDTGQYIKEPLIEMAQKTASKRPPEETEKLLKAQVISLIEMADGSPDSMKQAIVTLSMLLQHTFNLTAEGAKLISETASAINAKNKAN